MKAKGGAKHLAERKGKTDAMRSETTSRGWGVQSKGCGASAQAEGAVYLDPCAFLLHEPASRTIRKHGGQGSILVWGVGRNLS
jgi:hypothetical protein